MRVASRMVGILLALAGIGLLVTFVFLAKRLASDSLSSRRLTDRSGLLGRSWWWLASASFGPECIFSDWMSIQRTIFTGSPHPGSLPTQSTIDAS
jgi:hypothetical protein